VRGFRATDYFEDPRVVALAAAAARGDVKEVDQLIAGGVDVNAMGKEEMTPLWWAFLARNLDGFASLLDHGASPNVKDAKGRSIMCQAAAREDSRYLQRALAAGGNPDGVSRAGIADESIPIFCAVGNKNVENIKLLHSVGADLNMQEYHRETPMMYAAALNWWDIVYVLLELGADPSIENTWGKTIVYRIESRSMERESELYAWRTRVVERLRERGMSVTPQN
jgi:ankyrin repeat protein